MPGSPESGPTRHDDEPWVFVTSKKNRRGGRRHLQDPISFHGSPAVPIPATDTAVSSVRKAPTGASGHSSALAAASQIQVDHARITAWWRGQPSYRLLETLVSAQASTHVAITQALCFGAGSFGGPLDGGEAFRRAHIQTAAFLLIAQLLGQGGRPVPCYFQEPLYTDADKNYLRSLGHTVVEPPIATQLITETSLVFAVHFPLREYMACLSGALPAMLVGTSYGTCEGLPQFSTVSNPSPALQPLYVVECSFDAYDFPQEKQDYCFSDTLIYWRPRDIGSSI